MILVGQHCKGSEDHLRCVRKTTPNRISSNCMFRISFLRRSPAWTAGPVRGFSLNTKHVVQIVVPNLDL